MTGSNQELISFTGQCPLNVDMTGSNLLMDELQHVTQAYDALEMLAHCLKSERHFVVMPTKPDRGGYGQNRGRLMVRSGRDRAKYGK